MAPHKKSFLSGVLFVLCAPFILCPFRSRADTASEIRQFTGAPTRVVWIQDAGPTACVYSESPTIRLMGFDTEDSKGERAILPDIGWYAKPQLTADGNRIVFHNLADKTVDVVNFDGTGLRQVVKDAGEFEDDATWTDPKTGVVWVYAQIIEQRGGQPVPTIRRFQLDHPEVSELIWDKTPAHMFMLSGDGRVASGGVGNGGNTPQGMFTLPNGSFIQRGGGCWPSMAPDASHRMWVFTGNHRSIHFCVPTNRSGAAAGHGVRFEAPGLEIKNNEEMYHPRWTNNVHYLVLDSPFSHWSWTSANAKIPMDVAANVEIYIGKFTDDFNGIERWVRVTHNNVGDYWPNVWIKPPKNAAAELAAAPELPVEKPSAPPDNKGLVYTWTTGGDSNQLIDPVTGAIHQCSGQFKNNARYGRFHVMDLTDGAFVPDEAADRLLGACKASNQFAVETVVTPTGQATAGETIIMAFADDPANGNFVLAQKGDLLTLRLKTDGTGSPARPIPLFNLVRDRPNHLIVSYAGGTLACYLNGRQMPLPGSVQGGLTNWTAQPLIFGDAWKGGQNWTGLMEDIGLFSRPVSAVEARQRFLRYRQSAGGRRPVETVIVDAKLIGRCPAADPRGIAPYRRCLSQQLYQVVKVISGTCPDPKITVAQWSVLDGKVVPAYEKLAVGQTCRLAVEKMDDHPEQDSERSISGDFNANDTQLYYEVRTPDVVQTAPAAPQTNNLQAGAGSVPVPGMVLVSNPSADDLTSKGTVRLAGQGTVAAATVINGGFGYSQAPEVQVSGGGGQGASASAVMAVTSLDITKVGSGYTSEPAVVIAPPDLPTGRQAAAKARIDKAGGTVSGFIMTDAGAGYVRAPKVTFTGGGGAGAEAEAQLSVSEIVVTSGGSGYTAPPDVTLEGGDGQDASAQAALQAKVFRFTNPSANALFTNAGALEQDASAMIFDCATPQHPTGRFGFDNTGTWTLKNGACVHFVSSTGHSDWVGYSNSNGGTLSVLDHSLLGFAALVNSGTLELGAGVVLGQADYAERDDSLVNTGALQVVGSTPDEPATFGYIGADITGKRILENGTSDGRSQARLIIGSGQDMATFHVIGGQVDLSNFAGSSMEIQPGAMLELITNDNGSVHAFNNRDAKVANAGDLLLAGRMRVQGNHGGFTGIENSGKLTIRGDQALLERLPSSTGPGGWYEADKNSAQILNQPGGLVRGSGTLTYVNSTENKEGRYLQVTNFGTIAPGEPAAGQAQESFGALVLRDANVYFGAFTIPEKPRFAPATAPTPAPVPVTPPKPGILRIGIGGPPNAPGRFDTLTLSGSDDYGRLELIKTEGNTLNIVPVPGFIPHGTYRIVTAASVAGTFDTLQYNGSAQVPYTLNYLPDGIEVIFP